MVADISGGGGVPSSWGSANGTGGHSSIKNTDKSVSTSSMNLKTLSLESERSKLVEQLQKEMYHYVTAKFVHEEGTDYESGYIQKVNENSIYLWGRRCMESYTLDYLKEIVVFGDEKLETPFNV